MYITLFLLILVYFYYELFIANKKKYLDNSKQVIEYFDQKNRMKVFAKFQLFSIEKNKIKIIHCKDSNCNNQKTNIEFMNILNNPSKNTMDISVNKEKYELKLNTDNRYHINMKGKNNLHKLIFNFDFGDENIGSIETYNEQNEYLDKINITKFNDLTNKDKNKNKYLFKLNNEEIAGMTNNKKQSKTELSILNNKYLGMNIPFLIFASRILFIENLFKS
jgi:hypothetical protein